MHPFLTANFIFVEDNKKHLLRQWAKHLMRIAVCIVGVQIQEKHIVGLKPQLNDKQIN